MTTDRGRERITWLIPPSGSDRPAQLVKKAQQQLIRRYYLPPGADNGTFDTRTRNGC